MAANPELVNAVNTVSTTAKENVTGVISAPAVIGLLGISFAISLFFVILFPKLTKIGKGPFGT